MADAVAPQLGHQLGVVLRNLKSHSSALIMIKGLSADACRAVKLALSPLADVFWRSD